MKRKVANKETAGASARLVGSGKAVVFETSFPESAIELRSNEMRENGPHITDQTSLLPLDCLRNGLSSPAHERSLADGTIRLPITPIQIGGD